MFGIWLCFNTKQKEIIECGATWNYCLEDTRLLKSVVVDDWVNKLIELFKILIKINLEETLFEFSHVISVRIFLKKLVYSIIKKNWENTL